MGRNTNLLRRFVTIAILAGLGMVGSAKADTLQYTNQQVYYVGPESTDNPWGLTNPTGNTASYVGFTSAGTTATMTLSTTGTPGVSVISNTPGATLDIQLYGNTNAMIVGGQLQNGVYSFSSTQDVFSVNGSSNTGPDPTDFATITVSNGIVQLQSASLGVVTQINADPPAVPEIDPTNATSAFALIGFAAAMVRGRRRA
jgi:hypothetical protein